MNKISIEEIQKIQLNMLEKIENFCKKNNIQYFLGCGTLAGAVICKGFFPWDDDIDILMPREDYERFIKIFSSEKYSVLTCSKKDYYYPYAKMIDNRTIAYECKNNISGYGVFVDIFPIDGVPNSFFLKKIKILKYLMLSQWGCYLDNRSVFIKFIYKIISIITFPFPKNFFASKVNNMCKKHSIKNCLRGGIVCHYRYNREIMDSKIFFKKTYVEFEKGMYPALFEYEKYLNNLYIDYRKEDNKKSHKHFNAYRK